MLDLKKIFRAVITLMLISLVFTPMVIFAQTEGQLLHAPLIKSILATLPKILVLWSISLPLTAIALTISKKKTRMGVTSRTINL